nr:MAG: RNA dependent RNA polymerase [Leviviridae sp.]
MKKTDERQKLSTDATMTNLWLCLEKDFSSIYGTEVTSRIKMQFLKEGPKGFRTESFPSRTSNLPPYLFKWLYQLENLFKRYRFADDLYDDAQLEREAREKFRATQLRCATPLVVTSSVYLVLQRARRIATSILGKYDKEEHQHLCRFGKRACQGTPYRESYLDVKLMSSPFTGSTEHLAWLRECMQRDEILNSLLMTSLIGSRACAVECLLYACVPKSYKAFRGMMPDTLAGSYYTAGLGRVIQDRLKTRGLDIRYLQRKHMEYAKHSSEKRRLVTADLSSASDSITLELLRRILPTQWYRAVTFGRARYVLINDEKVLLSSIVTMGLGITFPLQTLIFYCLLKAIGELLGGRHFVSVYGDDLVYSRRMHKYVVKVFPQIHLILNEDKTYVKDHFRESCGGDYYRGVDVRPYQPEGCSQHLDGFRRQNFLYRLYNGLKQRWDRVECPMAFDYLEAEMCSTGQKIHQVPPSFPDGSGIKVSIPRKGDIYHPVLWSNITEKDYYLTWGERMGSNYQMSFKYLREVGDNRVVQKFQLPYYWESMRLAAQCETDEPERWDSVADTPQIRWIKAQRNPRYVSSTITGRRFRRLVAVVTKKGSARLQAGSASISCWL